jgi:protein phosphatase
MGGYQGGEVAAQIVAEQVQSLLTEAPRGTDPVRALSDAIEAVGRRVLEHADSDPSLANMGATVALALVDGETFHIAHVGDSRAYLLRNRSLQRLTTDHTVAQRLVKSGAISEAEARTHRDSSVLTRSIGGSAVLEPAEISGPFALEAGDMILLCSDGISGSLDDPTIAEVLLETQEAELIPKQLCQVAFDHGSDDNLTALIVRVNR